jgi:thiamine biosynthesis lipoprotein
VNLPLRRLEPVMGTDVTIDVLDPDAGAAAAVDDVVAWLHEVDRRFSTYRADSEVSRLGRGELRAEHGSADLRHVLEACADMREATGGYFDAFATGRFDPSGYVKGWSVEVASRMLAERGAAHHCVNAGGDIRVRGRAPDPEGWRIGIRHPWERDRMAWVIAVTDAAVATSGTYERGLHVLDPYTGRPADALISVTVIGPDLATADSYATAAMAMGMRGIDWLATLDGYESAVVTTDGAAFRSAGLPTVPERPAGPTSATGG